MVKEWGSMMEQDKIELVERIEPETNTFIEPDEEGYKDIISLEVLYNLQDEIRNYELLAKEQKKIFSELIEAYYNDITRQYVETIGDHQFTLIHVERKVRKVKGERKLEQQYPDIYAECVKKSVGVMDLEKAFKEYGDDDEEYKSEFEKFITTSSTFTPSITRI